MPRYFALLGVLILAVLMPQRAAATAEGSAAVADGLEVQYQASLVRERRLADDRESRLLSEDEDRLRRARLDYDRGLAGAKAALSQAREDYAKLVKQIADRDAASHAEIAAYRAEARNLAANATPERLAALQRFADGDRVGAWPVLDALRSAEDNAIQRASNARRAVRWREDAQLRNIMRGNGEATTRDVLALWEEAARLDPDDIWTQIELSRLYRDDGRLEASAAAAERAAQLARDSNAGDVMEYASLIEKTDIAVAGKHWDQALKLLDRRLELSRGWRRLVDNLPEKDRDAARVLTDRQISRDVFARSGVLDGLARHEEAMADAKEAVEIDERNAAIEPDDDKLVILAASRINLAMLYSDANRVDDALREAKLSFDALQDVIKRSPHKIDAIRYQGGAALVFVYMGLSGRAKITKETALDLYDIYTRNEEVLARSDPNFDNSSTLVDGLLLSGEIRAEFGIPDQAAREFGRVHEEAARMAAVYPSSDFPRREHALAAYYSAKYTLPGSSWPVAADLFEKIGTLTDDDRAKLAECRSHFGGGSP